MGAVVTLNVRIINAYSFEAGAATGEKGGVNRVANGRNTQMHL